MTKYNRDEALKALSELTTRKEPLMPKKIEVKPPIIRAPKAPSDIIRDLEARNHRLANELTALRLRQDMSLAELREDLTPKEQKLYLSPEQIQQAITPAEKKTACNFRACEYQSCGNCKHCNTFGTYCNLKDFWLRVPSADYTCNQWELLAEERECV